MAVKEDVTRRFTGAHRADGTPVYETTRHGRAARPESVDEWAEQRAAALGVAGTTPAGRVALALLQADGAAAVKAAVASGADLPVTGRWAVLQVLEKWRQVAMGEYQPAAGRVAELRAAWTRKWGTQAPRVA